MDQQFTLAIIGAGPAGLTCATYAARAGLSTILIDSGVPGGKMVLTDDIENYPGFTTIKGNDLADQMFDQALHFGSKYEYGEVTEIIDGEVKEVKLADGNSIFAKNVVIATGCVERKIGLPNEEKLTGKGVSYCCICDGAFFKGTDVVIIGGGNSATEAALYMTKFAKHVTIVEIMDHLMATKILVDQVENNPDIDIYLGKKTIELLEESGKVSGIVFQDVKTNEIKTIPCQGVFPYIGLVPMTDFTGNLSIEKENGYIVVNESMETSVKGIYAIGDVRKKTLRQVVTACNDGAIAAEAINKNK